MHTKSGAIFEPIREKLAWYSPDSELFVEC